MTGLASLLVGTAKGLVTFKQQADGWALDQVHFLGFPVSFVHVDVRNGTWWVGLAHRHWGQKLHYSTDQGRNWQVSPMPVYPEGTEVRPGRPAKLKRIWCLQASGADQPEVLWLGTEPGGLFQSKDNGQSWQLVESLWKHPSRLNANEWFGAGRDFPFIHSIVIDPDDSDHLYIAVSCAGVFESIDGGLHWEPRNKGLIAAYLPNPTAELGHDPHLVLACQSNPKILWQQNHCGIFRSTDGGKQWTLCSDPQSHPHYGFALAIDHSNPLRAWVIPAVSDEMRVAANLALTVYRTEDAGHSWQPLSNGLPQENCFDIVFRHSFARQSIIPTLAFGTTTGNLFLSKDDGENWQCLSSNLARVDCLAFG